jgi:hypothetical protein
MTKRGDIDAERPGGVQYRLAGVDRDLAVVNFDF